MTGAIALIASAEVKRRARSLAGLALVVAVVTAVVLTAAAGARSTASSFERFRRESRSADVWLQVNDTDVAQRIVATAENVPGVAEVAGWSIAPVAPVDAPSDSSDFALMGDPLGRLGVTVDKPRVLSGRLPAPDAVDEVMLTETAATTLGLATGDALRGASFAPDDLLALVEGGEFPGMNGAPVELEVVGIGRWPEEIGGRGATSLMAGFVSPAFLSESSSSVGTWPMSVRVHLEDGADVKELVAAARAVAGPDAELIVSESKDEYLASTQSAIDVLAVAVGVFGVIAAVAGLVVIAQAVSRHVGSDRARVDALVALGMSRRSRAASVALPVGLATLVGVATGALLSVLLSPLLPIGIARVSDPDVGVRADPVVLVLGSAVLLAAVWAWTCVAARSAARSTVRQGAGPIRRSRIAPSLARAGVGPVPVVGVRFAFDPGPPTEAVPVRAATAGAGLGVLGIVAVAVVSASLSGLVASPADWGWTWSSRPDLNRDAEQTVTRLAGDPRVEAIADLSYASIELDGNQMWGYAVDDVKGSTEFTVLEGTAPMGPGQVALGQNTMDDLGLDIGDTVAAGLAPRSKLSRNETGPAPSEPTIRGGDVVEFEVVGVASIPLVESSDPGRGAILTAGDLAVVRQSDGSTQLLLTYADGVDSGDLERDLRDSAGLGFPIYARPDPPSEVVNLGRAAGVIGALAAFFGLLGLVGVVHALSVAVRRRRRDLGVLRVLGMERSQARATVVWQAVAMTAVALVVGVPGGFAVGQFVWRALVGEMGVVTDPAHPWGVVAVLVPASLLVVALLALLIARRSVGGPTARMLER